MQVITKKSRRERYTEIEILYNEYKKSGDRLSKFANARNLDPCGLRQKFLRIPGYCANVVPSIKMRKKLERGKQNMNSY